jgi:HlyD family secretion protein
MIVPVSALFRHGKDWAVYVVTGDRATMRSVQIGEQAAGDAQVLGGLSAGDRVVLFPSDQITTGRRVRPAR